MRLLGLLATLLACYSDNAAHVVSRGANIDLITNKTITIVGEIDDAMVASVSVQAMLTRSLPGPTLVIISSAGGSVDSGKRIIDIIAKIGKTICVSNQFAHSMAFNIMTSCTVRLATPGTRMVAHKISIMPNLEETRLTARAMREAATELDKTDAYWDRKNAAALHLDLPSYNNFAERDYPWTVSELLVRGYLQGIGNVD